MNDHVYKIIEVTGTSTANSDEAIQNALARAAQNVRHLRWFEVIEQRGTIENDHVYQWQVTLKIGFSLEE